MALRKYLGAVDAGTGALTTWNPSPNMDYVSAVAIAGSTVYTGGGFAGMSAIDASTGTPSQFAPEISGVVAIVPLGGTIYVAGDFSGPGPYRQNGLAALIP